ncbi:MAG: hypothetical protein FWF29_01100 [Treponema sp.]|nr:hypothetical protein [Treponema sp.]
MNKRKILGIAIFFGLIRFLPAGDNFTVQQCFYIPENIKNYAMAYNNENKNGYINFNFDLQMPLGSLISITMQPYFTFYRQHWDQNNTITSNFGFDPGIKIFPHRTGPRGFFVGINALFGLSYNNIDIYGEQAARENYFRLGLVAQCGYQIIFKNGLTLTIGGTLGRSTLVLFEGNSPDHRSYTWLDYTMYGLRTIGNFFIGDYRDYTMRESHLNELNARIAFGYTF